MVTLYLLSFFNNEPVIENPMIFEFILAPIIVAAVTGGFGWWWGHRQSKKKIDAAPRVFVDELDKLISDAHAEGRDKAIVNGRAIVAARNTLKRTLDKINSDLNSEIDALGRAVGEPTGTFDQLRQETQRPNANAGAAYETIEVLYRMWPVKKKQVETDIRVLLAILGIDIRATNHDGNRP